MDIYIYILITLLALLFRPFTSSSDPFISKS